MTVTQWDALEVVLVTGTRVRVVAECIIGPFAIHRKLWGGFPVGEGWTVTHRETGLCIWSVLLEDDARRVAHWLEEKGIIPPEMEAMLTWRRGLSSSDKTKLIGELTAVAPRFVTPGDVAAARWALHHPRES